MIRALSKLPEKRDADASRDKILEAAEYEFAEKGFDGARVAEIARRARVNKALLYYYFGSKETLLEALIRRNIDETNIIMDDAIGAFTVFSEEAVGHFIDRIIDFIERKKEIIRILYIEALKNEAQNKFIFDMFDPFYQKIFIKLKELDHEVPDRVSMLLENFFIATVPLLVFFTLGERWSKYYQLSPTEAKAKFIAMYKSLHFNYFKV